MERLHILDGYGYVFRAFYGIGGGRSGAGGVRLSTADGLPTGGLYVYARMLIKLYMETRPERMVVVFDAPGKSFRYDIDPEYKANRKERPEDLTKQMPYFRPLTEAFSWPVMAVPGVEADDVIASLARRAHERDWAVTIFSADKDMMCLVDERTTFIDSMRNIEYDRDRVIKKFGVEPALVSQWLALVGDTSDNIPGMAGVGKKTAAKLLNEYGSIDNILAHVDDFKGKMKERFQDPEQLERLERSRKLVALKDDVELDVDLEDLKPGEFDGDKLREMFTRFEFQVLLDALEPTSQAEAGDIASGAGAVDIPDPVIALEPAAIEPVLAAAREHKRLAVHLEGDGARLDRERVVGMALAAPDVAPIYIPFGHRYLSAPTQMSMADLPDEVAHILVDPEIEVVGHDIKAVYRRLGTMGLALEGPTFDTMLAAYLIDASSDNYALEKVMKQYAKIELRTHKSLLGKGKNAISFESVLVEDAAAYAAVAAAAMLPASEKARSQLERLRLTDLMNDLELPLARLLAKVEAVGITLDVVYLRNLSDELGERIAQLEARIFELAGHEINVGSPKQLSALLFDELGLRSEKMKKTKTGFSTDHEVLESMRDMHEIIGPILEHRELIKLRGTYVDALPPLVNPNTGRIHTSFNQAVASTGRLSSQDPNLQNIPIRSEMGRQIRRAFIAPEGYKLVSADYSQIELRILAHLSGDPVLTRAFKEDIDVHAQTAAEVFGIPLEEVGPDERRVAKAVNYGLAYGQSDFGLARTLDIPRTEARHYIETYFQRFATVKFFMDKLIADAGSTGEAVTVLGRRRPVKDIHSRNYQRRMAAQRIAQNTPMQGSGADIIKLAMLAADRLVIDNDWDATMLLTVHDELVFEVADADVEGFSAAVKETMEKVYELRVPLKADVGVAQDWSGAH
jgi:DNA polymerase-1